MEDEIYIRKSLDADTRSANHMVSKEELKKSTCMHIADVRKAMRWIASQIVLQGDIHDWTKLDYLDDFYKQFHRAQQTGEWGEGWYDRIHIKEERHHLSDKVPQDVDLIDVLEHLCDCVMAGLARTGEYRNDAIDPEVLSMAYDNTVKKLLSVVKVVE